MKPKTFRRNVPDIGIDLNVYMDDPDLELVRISSAGETILLNAEEALMLRAWLNKALPR